MGLDAADRAFVLSEARAFPVAPQLQPVERLGDRTFESDQHLAAACLAHEFEQFFVLVHRDVRLRKPADAPLREFRQQFAPVTAIDERIIVGEFDERTRPDRSNAVDLGEHLADRLLLVLSGEKDRTRAKLAAPGTAAARLYRNPVIAADVKQLESRHRRRPEVEFEAANIVKRRKTTALGGPENFRPG